MDNTNYAMYLTPYSVLSSLGIIKIEIGVIVEVAREEHDELYLYDLNAIRKGELKLVSCALICLDS